MYHTGKYISNLISNDLNRRFAAFTLPEVVVSMLLTAVLLTTASIIYTILIKQFQAIEAKNRFYSNYYITQKTMGNDLEKAFYISVGDSKKTLKLQLKRNATNNDYIFYEMHPDYLLRKKGERIDTLQPGGTITYSKILSDTIPLITYIKIESLYQQQTFFTYHQKNYSAEQTLTYPEP